MTTDNTLPPGLYLAIGIVILMVIGSIILAIIQERHKK